MGLYLCVFDKSGKELDGVEVGAYSDFNFFRDAVIATVEKGTAGSVCPVLINHLDSDGEWSSDDAQRLKRELETVAEVMSQLPAVEYNSPWKTQVAKTFGLKPTSLLGCFFDVDGESLVERLHRLADISIASHEPILFQ